MPVTKRGNSWQAAATYKGKRLRKDFPTEQEAEVWLHRALAQLKSGLVDAPKPPAAPTLAEHLEKVSEVRWIGTKGEYTALMNARHVVEMLGPSRSVSSLTKDDVLALKVGFREQGITEATINRKLAAFSVLVKEAVEWGYLTRPFKMGLAKEKQGRVRYLTEAEEEELLRLAEAVGGAEFYSFLIVSLDTGFRLSETLSIRASDVGGADLWTYDTKGGNNRGVPLTPRAAEELGKLVSACTTTKEPIFKLTALQMRARWRKVQKIMGMEGDADFVIHAMRHTFVTRLLERGVDIETVRELAGHESITTTQRYAHTSPERKLAAIRKLAGG